MKFKPYQQDIPSMFPLNFGDMTPKTDPVRILNHVDEIDQTLQGQDVGPKIKAKVKRAKKN